MNASETGTDERERTADTDGIETEHDVVIVGGGVAGLSAGIFTARAGLDTLVVDDADRGSILQRNAHLENFPGFPAGVNTRLFLDMTEEQAERAGCTFLDGVVTGLREAEGETRGFELATESGETIATERVIAASWADSSYLDGLDVEIDRRGSKGFVLEADNDGPQAGHTGVEGLYAAGRIADQYHQAIVTAGHGARVGLTLVHDADVSLYHDWSPRQATSPTAAGKSLRESRRSTRPSVSGANASPWNSCASTSPNPTPTNRRHTRVWPTISRGQARSAAAKE